MSTEQQYRETIRQLVATYYRLRTSLTQYQEEFGELDERIYHIFTHKNGLKSLMDILAKYFQRSSTRISAENESQGDLERVNPFNLTHGDDDLNSPLLNRQEKGKYCFPKDESALFNSDRSVLPKEQSSSQKEQQNYEQSEYCEVKEEEMSLLKRKKSENQSNWLYRRGPYKTYTKQQKQLAVELFNQGLPITHLSQHLGIPCKNIKRWAEFGIQRKLGAGRKRFSPEMEEKLCRWITKTYQKGSQISLQRLQRVALHFANDRSFKASRGWVVKFVDRYKLKKNYRVT